MAVTGLLGKGTILQRDTGVGSANVIIGNVTSISGPGASSDLIDITNHNSTTRYREFIGGMNDGGEVTASINYDPAMASNSGAHADSKGHNRLLADVATGAEDTYQIVFPDASSHFCEFPGTVTSVSLSSPVDGVHTMDMTIKVVGAITWPV
jgi:predicted secreted protein